MASCPKICTGDLKHPVEVQRNTPVDDEAGGYDESWATIETIYCKIKQKSGNEAFQQQNIRAISTHSFWTRYGSSVVEEDRLLYRGDFYNVRNVENIDERDMWLKIDAEKGVVDAGQPS